MNKNYDSKNPQSGFSLIEILVTLLVLSIGLLGLAGLQGQSLTNNNESFARSTVTNLSNDIINRMAANRASAITAPPGGYSINIAKSKSIQALDCETATGCTPGDTIGHDLYIWDDALATQLENGVGLVCFDSTPNDNDALPADGKCDNVGPVYAIKIWWGPDNNNDNVPDNSFVTSYQP